MNGKKLLLGLIVALFILGLLALIFMKVVGNVGQSPVTTLPGSGVAPTSSGGATNQDPQKFTTNFYKWYLENIARNETFPYTGDLSAVLGPWIAPDFIAHWEEYLSTFEVDPVLLTKDDPVPWGTDIKAETLSQTATGATLHVTIAGGTPNVHTYIVTLVPSTGNMPWKISSVKYTAP